MVEFQRRALGGKRVRKLRVRHTVHELAARHNETENRLEGAFVHDRWIRREPATLRIRAGGLRHHRLWNEHERDEEL